VTNRVVRTALSVLLCVVVAGCGGGRRAGPAHGESIPLTPEQSVSSDAALVDNTAGGAPGGAAESGAPAVESDGPTQTQPAASGLTPPPTPSGVGSFASFYLRAAESASIVLAVGVQSDAAPATATIDHLIGVVQQASGKSVRLQVETISAGARSWTATDLVRTAELRAPQQSRAAAVMNVLFVRGDYEGDTGVLGVAVRSDIAAVFVDQVAGSAGLLGGSAVIERSVSTHEVGHLLGLVDLFLATGRGDPAHPGHSTSSGSVMYWAVESDVIGAILGANPPTEFDAADLADLATIRSG
jgi:hypothetical protein